MEVWSWFLWYGYQRVRYFLQRGDDDWRLRYCGKISLLVLCAQKREKKEKKNLRSAKRVAVKSNIQGKIRVTLILILNIC
jgi:hypothetical protein